MSPAAALGMFLALSALGQNPPGLDFSKVGMYACDYDFLDFANLKFTAESDPAAWAAQVHACKQRGQYVMMGLYTWDRVWHTKPLEQTLADTDRILNAVNLDEVDMIFLSEEEVDWSNGLEYLNAIYDHVKAKYKGPVYQWYSMPMGPRCDQKADGWLLDAYGFGYERFRKHLMKFIVLDKPVAVCVNASPQVDPMEIGAEQVRVCEEFNVPVFFFCVAWPLGSPGQWLAHDDPEYARWRSWFFRTLEKCHQTDVSRLPAPSAQHSFSGPLELAGDETGQFRFADDFSTYSFIDQASLHGFLNIAWSSLGTEAVAASAGAGLTASEHQAGAIWLKAAREPRDAELIWHFTTPFAFQAPSARVVGAGDLSVEISRNGYTWVTGTAIPGEQTTGEASLPDMVGQNVWVKVRLRAGPSDRPVTILRGLEVTGRFVPPADRAWHLTEAARKYDDDFSSQRYLHLGDITGKEDLTWSPGQLAIHGVQGRPVRVEIKQHFISEQPTDLLRVTLGCYARPALGGHNELAVSLDGTTPLASTSTVGRKTADDGRYDGELELNLAQQPQARALREFWVHMIMVNGSGAQTGTSNVLRRLSVETGGSK